MEFGTFKARTQQSAREMVNVVNDNLAWLEEYEARGGATYSNNFDWPDGTLTKEDYDALFYGITQLRTWWETNGIFFMENGT